MFFSPPPPLIYRRFRSFILPSELTGLHAVEVEDVERVLDGHAHVRHAEGLQVLQLLCEGLQVLLPAGLQRGGMVSGSIRRGRSHGMACNEG